MKADKVFRALGSPRRLEILKMIMREPLCQCEIERALPIDKTTLSRHVKTLREAGLIAVEHKGVMNILHLRDEQLIHIIRAVEDITDRVREVV